MMVIAQVVYAVNNFGGKDTRCLTPVHCNPDEYQALCSCGKVSNIFRFLLYSKYSIRCLLFTIREFYMDNGLAKLNTESSDAKFPDYFFFSFQFCGFFYSEKIEITNCSWEFTYSFLWEIIFVKIANIISNIVCLSIRISFKIVIYYILIDSGNIVSNKYILYISTLWWRTSQTIESDNKNRSQFSVTEVWEGAASEIFGVRWAFGYRKSLILCPYFPHKMW